MLRTLIGLSLSLAVLAGASAQTAPSPGRAVATFAGGCFWCVEADFDKVDGVISTTSGYIGGKLDNPTYRQVSSGGTGHAEAIEIVYDPSKVTYAKLLDVFWRNVDPLAKDRQFCDSGDMYRTAIFYHDEEQRRLAEETRKQVAERFKATIHTQVVAATRFYPAEDYHQDFYKKSKARYDFYRWNCGRDRRLEQLWGKPKSS